MKTILGLSTMALALAATLASSTAPAVAAADPGEEGDRLGATIERELRADGPFFTPEESAVIERACGYRQGEWDGFSVSINNGKIHCSNGRRAEGPEVRAVLAAAEPRIRARVERIMASPQVREAIAAIASGAAAEAMREAELALASLDDLDIDIELDGEDLDVDADVDVDVDPDADVDVDSDRDDD